MKRLIIDIRGTNGAGKSTIMRELIQRYSDKELHVIGRHTYGRPTGGMDALKMASKVVMNHIIDLHRTHTVVFEGAGVSTTVQAYRSLAELYGQNYVFCFMQTPLEECIRRREARRAGKKMRWDNSTLIKNWHKCHEIETMFRDEGHRVVQINTAADVIAILEGTQVMTGEARLVEEMISLSGSGKRVVDTRTHGLYSSVCLPLFEHLPAVRDTAKRFADFGITTLGGLSVLDLGCNVGAVSFYALTQMSASYVQGYEYNTDRVQLLNDIKRYYGWVNCRFDFADFRDPLHRIMITRDRADVVFCCSVDEYIEDRTAFYSFLLHCTKIGGTLYLESNVQRDQDIDDTIGMLHAADWRQVDYLGNGHSGGISRRRKLFKCQ